MQFFARNSLSSCNMWIGLTAADVIPFEQVRRGTTTAAETLLAVIDFKFCCVTWPSGNDHSMDGQLCITHFMQNWPPPTFRVPFSSASRRQDARVQCYKAVSLSSCPPQTKGYRGARPVADRWKSEEKQVAEAYTVVLDGVVERWLFQEKVGA